jgi:hypothetical protein
MGDAAAEGDDAVEGKDAVDGKDTGDWEPRAAATARMTTSRPATQVLRMRIRRGAVRAGSL